MSPPAGSTDPLVGDLRRAGPLALHGTADEPSCRHQLIEPIARAIRAVRAEVLEHA